MGRRTAGTWARAAVAAAAGLLAWPSPSVAGPWHAHHERGLELLAQGDAAGAEAELREALKRRPRSGCVARVYGVKFRTYVPHYHLALALQQQGRAAEAAVELSRELAQGVIGTCAPARDLAADLERRLGEIAVSQGRTLHVAAGQPGPAASPDAPRPAALLVSSHAPTSGPQAIATALPGAASPPQAAAVLRAFASPAPVAGIPPLLGVGFSQGMTLPPQLLPPRRP